MLTSSRILASIVVFTTAAAANAQDYRGFYSPVQTQYGVTQTNYQPYISSSPCLTGNCPQVTNSPYLSTANYGYSQACVNGSCNHPQHQTVSSNFLNWPTGQCVNGQCATGQCANGQCKVGQYGNCANGRCGNSQYPSFQPFNGISGISTIPFNQAYPVNYGAATPYGNSQYRLNVSTVPDNAVTTRPIYGTPAYRPVTSSPYYN